MLLCTALWLVIINTKHLYFENIYEVTGEHPHFKPNVISGKPTSTSRHERTIFVYEINDTEAIFGFIK